MINPELSNQLRINLIGGGGATPLLFAEFVNAHPEACVTAHIGVADSGGSAGRLREARGGPAVGDLRPNLSAVSANGGGLLLETRFGPRATLTDVKELNFSMYELLTSKDNPADEDVLQQAYGVFARTLEIATSLDDLDGHAYGNLLLTSARELCNGDLVTGTALVGKMVKARAEVIPLSNDDYHLVMDDGKQIIYTEGVIDEHTVADPENAKVWLVPDPGRNPLGKIALTTEARTALENSDITIFAPGSLFTTVEANAAIPGMAEAFEKQRERGGFVLAIMNLVEETRATAGLRAPHYVQRIQRAIGRVLNKVIYNSAVHLVPEGKVPLSYAAEDLTPEDAGRLVGESLVDPVVIEHNPNDKIAHLRSPARHKVKTVVRLVMQSVTAATAEREPAVAAV